MGSQNHRVRANNWMQSYHDRMPVILDEEDFDGWLEGSLGADVLKCASESALREWLGLEAHKKGG
jgi:putative SOS response-associated peptidase YedK